MNQQPPIYVRPGFLTLHTLLVGVLVLATVFH